jgi:cytochrome c553
MGSRSPRFRYAFRLLAVGLCAVAAQMAGSQTAFAQAEPSKAQLCSSCHGAGGVSTMPEVPSLAGQPAYYLVLQMILFHSNQRQSPRMTPIAALLTDADMQALGAYFSKLSPPTPAGNPNGPDAAQGQRLADANHCASCHLDGFAGQNQMPRLAGQREDYLLKAMREFRDAQRSGLDGTMTEVLHGLSDADLATLARYLAQVR